MSLAIAAALSACASPTEPDPATAVDLTVAYDADWGLTELEVRIDGRETTGRAPAKTKVRILVNDALAGVETTLLVAGYRSTDRWASGRVTVVPVLHSAVAAQVTLARLPCGNWCDEGATECVGDGVAICEQRDSDACMEWSEPVPCAGDAPYCSLGACRTTAIDECATGETRCAGPTAVQACGQGDNDSALDWLPATDCGEGETCSSGACRSGPCTSECIDGGLQCADSGVSTCGDRNADGCWEWGPSVACKADQTCEDGACIAIDDCHDGCDASACESLTYRQCGNFDADPCLEPSPGSSCVPTDSCLVGTCSAVAGCGTAPKCPGGTCDDGVCVGALVLVEGGIRSLAPRPSATGYGLRRQSLEIQQRTCHGTLCVRGGLVP